MVAHFQLTPPAPSFTFSKMRLTGEVAGVKNPDPNYDHLTCHAFRHTFAREWKKRGGSIESLAKILAHSSIATTLDVHGGESLEDVQENYQKIMQVAW